MDIIQVKSTALTNAIRFIKNKFSLDAHDSVQIAPFGDDSVPLPNIKGIKSKTTTDAIHVILGYFNRNLKANPGEKRLYSLKEDGTESAYLYLKNNSSFELGCSDGFLMQYNPDDKTLNVNCDLIVTGNIKATGEVTAISETLQINLSTHKHTSPAGPTGSPIPTT